MRDRDQSKEQLIAEVSALREQLARLEPQSQRLREQQSVLLSLATSSTLRHAELEPALREITEAAGEYLHVARASVWLYNEGRSSIRCLDLFDERQGEHSAGLELLEKDFPGYFEALSTERIIDAEDAHHDPRTCEFSASYLTSLGIGAMLDAPIRGDGRMLGVVCHEHVGAARSWTAEELSFAASIGDLVSLALASYERRRAQQERQALEAKVLQAQKLESLGILAGGIAHDFNNLLVGILGNAQVAREELSPGSSAFEVLGEVAVAARRASDLCNQLLAYSGRGKFVVGSHDLGAVVEQMSELLAVTVSKKATLRVRLDPERPCIEADVTQIRQVLMNLIMNASDAMDDEPGTIEIVTGVTDCDRADLDRLILGDRCARGRYAFVGVSDEGAGMELAAVEKIFDPFYTTKFTGRGLGLAAVLGIVRSHRGAIEIESAPGHGTTVRVLFPLAAPVDHAVEPRLEPSEWGGQGRILLVDDDEVVRTVGRRIMQRAGFEVLTACDGVDGLERFRDHAGQIACVVLDLTMPRMSGKQMLQELRRLDQDVPVVLCSGYSEQEVVGIAGAAQVGFVKKPYDRASLISALRVALGGAAAPEDAEA